MASSTESPLVLLTGAMGFVGAHILDSLLTNNYRVIAPIRPSSVPKTAFFTTKYSHLPANTLTFVPLASQTDPALLLPLLTGVSAIIHTASVIPDFLNPSGDVVSKVLEPTLAMVTALFEAAVQVDSVKRFVLTSSSTTVYGTVDMSREEYTEDDWNGVTMEDVLKNRDAGTTYMASKTFAEKKLGELTREYRPRFDVVALCPPMVLGTSKHEVTGLSSVGGSAAPIQINLLSRSTIPLTMCPQFINPADAAEAHLAAITAPLARTPDALHRYLIASGTYSYHRLIPALLKRYPQLEGRLPEADPGKYGEVLPPFRVEKARRELGVRLDRGWEGSLVEGLWGEVVRYL